MTSFLVHMVRKQSRSRRMRIRSMEGLEKLHQQLENSTIESLSLVVLYHFLAPPPLIHTHTYTHQVCMYKVYSEPLSRQDCLFYYSSYGPLFDSVLPGWTHQSAVMLLEGWNCPLCSRLLLRCYPGEVQLSERDRGAKNNMVDNLNNKLLGIWGCAASRLPLTFPKRIMQNLSVYSSPVQWGQNSRVVKYFGSRFFLSTFLHKLVFQKK